MLVAIGNVAYLTKKIIQSVSQSNTRMRIACVIFVVNHAYIREIVNLFNWPIYIIDTGKLLMSDAYVKQTQDL